jgi:aspartate/methionine/tyrosine aminotransferase
MQAGASVRTQIQERTVLNHTTLAEAAGRRPAMRLLAADGGWSAIVQVPSIRSEDDWVLTLLEHADLLVHPGYFFDFDREAFLVVSLLPEPPRFAAAIERLCRCLESSEAIR